MSFLADRENRYCLQNQGLKREWAPTTQPEKWAWCGLQLGHWKWEPQSQHHCPTHPWDSVGFRFLGVPHPSMPPGKLKHFSWGAEVGHKSPTNTMQLTLNWKCHLLAWTTANTRAQNSKTWRASCVHCYCYCLGHTGCQGSQEPTHPPNILLLQLAVKKSIQKLKNQPACHYQADTRKHCPR